MITPIITIAEADAFLAAYPDWLTLTDDQKTAHIYNGSLYIQTTWTCVDVDGDAIDWTDTANIPEEIKNACALYAYADSLGNLYGSVATADTRKTTKEMVKAGSVTIDEEFAAGGSSAVGVKGSFGLPDTLMGLYCKGSGTCGAALIRN